MRFQRNDLVRVTRDTEATLETTTCIVYRGVFGRVLYTIDNEVHIRLDTGHNVWIDSDSLEVVG